MADRHAIAITYAALNQYALANQHAKANQYPLADKHTATYSNSRPDHNAVANQHTGRLSNTAPNTVANPVPNTIASRDCMAYINTASNKDGCGGRQLVAPLSHSHLF